LLNARRSIEVSPDGCLTVYLAPHSDLLTGRPVTLSVFVSDVLPVSNAIVTGITSLGSSLSFSPLPNAPGGYGASMTMPEQAGSLTVDIQVVAPARMPFSTTRPFTIYARPVNDDFQGSEAIPVGGYTARGTTRYATRESGEPFHYFEGFESGSVWWSWTAPASGRVTIDTRPSLYMSASALKV
jgi:hypothetical protein